MTAQSESPPEIGEALISQAKAGFRARWPVWLQRMPQYNFPPPNEDFQLIDRDQLKQVLTGVDEEIVAGIEADIKHMDYELLRLFRKLDYEAKYQQNRYFLYQIAYMVLAFAATLIGSTLALALDAKPGLVPWLAFAETVVALLTTYLATLSGREPPMPLWVSNRRRAEAMRREYFRYLLNLPPYDEVTGYQREMQLSRRAADINRGFFGEGEGST
jgi:hypothetical protein